MTAPTSAPATTAPATCKPWCVRHDAEYDQCLSDFLPTLPVSADVRVMSARKGSSCDEVWINFDAYGDFLTVGDARILAAAITAACDLAETDTCDPAPVPGSDAATVRNDAITPAPSFMPGDVHAQALGFRDMGDWHDSHIWTVTDPANWA